MIWRLWYYQAAKLTVFEEDLDFKRLAFARYLLETGRIGK
jgi:hypothetical protein